MCDKATVVASVVDGEEDLEGTGDGHGFFCGNAPVNNPLMSDKKPVVDAANNME